MNDDIIKIMKFVRSENIKQDVSSYIFAMITPLTDGWLDTMHIAQENIKNGCKEVEAIQSVIHTDDKEGDALFLCILYFPRYNVFFSMHWHSQ